MAIGWHTGLVLLCDLVILLVPDENLCSIAAFVLLWVLPGWAWGRALNGRWLVGLGLGVAIHVFLALLLSYLPGAVPFGLSLGLFTLSALAPAFLSRSSQPALTWPSLPVLVVLLVAATVRVPNLGYSEFQGDEGVVMLRTAAVIEGSEEQFFLHQKGPAEILVPLATWRLGHTINEFWARLPFAWLSLLSVAAVVDLGKRWFDGTVGWIAGLIVAISGLHVAFARIVQNQSFVVLMGLLGLLVLDEYRERGCLRDVLLGAVFAALSLWGHYDAVLSFPVAAALALRWTPGRPWSLRRAIANRPLLYALAVGVVILALFYVPFAFHPNLAKTVGYLTEDRVRMEGKLHLNFEKIWGVSTVYNATYYYVALLVLVPLSLVTLKKYRLSLLAWLAFVVPFGFYLIVVFDPRTHVYTFYASASLLAGAAVTWLWGRLTRTALRWGIVAVGGGAYLLCAGYIWMLFVDHTPEYVRTYPENKSPLYWTSYDEIFTQGLFGFPYRAGWQAISGLMAEGRIVGVYGSNEEQEITDWYTRQAPRIHCPGPDVYMVAEGVQDPIYIDPEELASDYALAGTVLVDGRARLRWYGRTAVEPVTVDEADYRQWWRPDEVIPTNSGWTHPVDATLGGEIQLAGYDLDGTHAVPGGWVRVTLYWRPLVPLRRNYQVFVHLYDGQRLWGQHDGAPECTINATTRWEPGQVIPDPHIVPIPEDVPIGPMPLLVGMYDLLTFERLVIPSAAGNALRLTEVQVRESP
ncbi:MAG: glycosyltransferase family 39 protein [Anaerolineae bacterium]|nr:glycosyltransferase family 39 protein [Anaerolineae bacterium]